MIGMEPPDNRIYRGSQGARIPTIFVGSRSFMSPDEEVTARGLRLFGSFLKEHLCQLVSTSFELGVAGTELDFRRRGFPDDAPLRFCGHTPYLGVSTGLEVAVWLATQAPHTPRVWAVIDSFSNDLGVETQYVKVNPQSGFDEVALESLRDKLGL